MAQRARATILIAVVAAGCGADLKVPEGLIIICESDAQCPGDQICAPGLNECVDPGSQIEAPELQVSFTEPSQGARDVSVRPTIVLAFSAAIDLESLAGRVHLTEIGAAEVPLTRNTDDTDNVFRYGLAGTDALAGDTPYRLTVDAGVRPAPGQLARPMGEPGFSADFRTGPAPDLDAPDAATGLVVDRIAEDQTRLTWVSSDPEARVLIVRRAGAPIDGQPTPGQQYRKADPVGAAHNVVVEDTTPAQSGSWTDIAAAGGPYDYAVWVYDDANNFSDVARAPFAAAETVTWCTQAQGSFQIEAAGADTQQLHIASVSGTFDTANLYPSPGATPGVTTELPVGGPIAVGNLYYVRPVLAATAGQYRGLERTFATDSDAIGIAPLAPVGVGGTATLTFDPAGWETIEAQFDTNPVASAATWESVTPIGNQISAVLPSAGEYQFQIRPVRTGCPNAADWTQSPVVMAGNFFYVDANATGDGDGRDPANAFTSIQAAIDAANANYEIFVRGGIYEEQLYPSTKLNITVTGSYDGAFTTADRRQTPTVVRSTSSSPAFLGDLANGRGSFVQLRFENTSGGGNAVEIAEGTVTLRDCAIEGATGVSISWASATPTIEACTITGSGATNSVGARVSAGADPVIERSLLDGGAGSISSTGLVIDSALGRYEANEIRGGMGLATVALATAGTGTESAFPVVVNNVIIGQGTGDSSRGVVLGIPTTLVNNTIDGGSAAQSIAVALTSIGRVANNIVFTSAGTDRICYQAQGGGRFVSLFADAMFDCPTARLRDLVGTPTDWDLLPGSGTFGDSMSSAFPQCFDLRMAQLPSDMNKDVVLLSGRGEAAFVSGTDFHLTSASPASLKTGGLNTETAYCRSDSGCMFDDCSCGNVTLDKDGRDRTCFAPENDCYSRGAYELDAPP